MSAETIALVGAGLTFLGGIIGFIYRKADRNQSHVDRLCVDVDNLKIEQAETRGDIKKILSDTGALKQGVKDIQRFIKNGGKNE